MSKKLCLAMFILLPILTACAPAAASIQPTTTPDIIVSSVQSTFAPAATAALNQPTTAPDEIVRSGDLCGGTGGNGQIISIGNNEFTMKRNDDGSAQVVHLTSQATIKTSAGSASLSDLKAGYRVTLVGGPNPDGSFTADTVVLCNGVVP